MDSVSQIALGAAVSVAVLGRSTAMGKAVAWGAIAGTLPDLDVFIDHGDPVLNMVLHRAETHALLWLALASVPLGMIAARLFSEWGRWRRWVLATAWVLLTHPLLDVMTIYGTQLALPFSNHPYGVGSVFVIDPLFTLPLLLGTGWAWIRAGSAVGRRGNALGLALALVYLAWGFGVQQYLSQRVEHALQRQGLTVTGLLVTPMPFNSLLWRVVAVDAQFHYEGFVSLLDASPVQRPPLHLDRYDRGARWESTLADSDSLRRIAAFSKGFYRLRQQGDQLEISDLRMGQEPAYVFTFTLAQRQGEQWVPLAVPRQTGVRPDVARGLPWLWRRALGEDLPPPR